ncbi:hypothetical protein PMAYCL1PPCAC_25553, partial [Pristionchus mayeri]
EVDVVMFQVDGTPFKSPKETFIFDDINSTWIYNSPLSWGSIMSRQLYNVDDKVAIQFRVNIIPKREVVADPEKFASPSKVSNVIL